ncbi:MAG: site-specific integrase, partial [Thermodesulfovibrionales bacterium]|nr:site-specific integrase [Thermodesulfovibrionales bacterium]
MGKFSDEAIYIISNFISDISSKEDLNPKTIKEYHGDLNHFANWFENIDAISENSNIFTCENIATPTLIRYRDYMQKTIKLKPATINRRIITIKRFFDWAMNKNLIQRNPSKPIKLIPSEKSSPRQMTEKEESNLIAAVEHHGSLRDLTILTIMLHTGLR